MTDAAIEFNTELAKKMRELKRHGAQTIRQGYRGTGSQSHRRQIFIRFFNGKCIDLWLERGRVEFGGVIRAGVIAPVVYGKEPDATPDNVYSRVRDSLKALADSADVASSHDD